MLPVARRAFHPSDQIATRKLFLHASITALKSETCKRTFVESRNGEEGIPVTECGEYDKLGPTVNACKPFIQDNPPLMVREESAVM